MIEEHERQPGRGYPAFSAEVLPTASTARGTERRYGAGGETSYQGVKR
jgi:hypothetical protein